MTTATDDIGPRLAAVEAHISNINTQLAEINANQRQLREQMQTMQANHQADIRDLNARIERMQWSIIGFGSALIITMLGLIITLLLKL